MADGELLAAPPPYQQVQAASQRWSIRGLNLALLIKQQNRSGEPVIGRHEPGGPCRRGACGSEC